LLFAAAMFLGRFLGNFPKSRGSLLSATKSTMTFQASIKFDDGWEAQLKKECVVLVDVRNSDELEAKPCVMQVIHVQCLMADESDAIMQAEIEKGSLPPDKKSRYWCIVRSAAVPPVPQMRCAGWATRTS